jgi:peptide/nickel transport system permease protein
VSASVDVVETAPQAAAAASEAPRFFRRLVRRPIAVVCLGYVAVIVGIAILAPILMPGVASEQAGDLLSVQKGPTWHHLLGTDSLGRDVLDRLLVGTRPTLLGVAEAVLVALVLGVPLGLVAGYVGGGFDATVGWIADLLFSIPGIVLVLVVLAVFPGSMLAGMSTLGVLLAPSMMRVVRSAVLPIRAELYIAAAQVSGLSRLYIIRRHVLPRIAGPVIVQTSLLAATALIVQTGLSFLNLLVAVPAPSWGGMVADGASIVVVQPWLIWPPGVAITLTILAFGLLGDTLRDTTAETWMAAPHTRARRRGVAAADGPAPAGHLDERSESLLSIEGLTVSFDSPAGQVRVVEGVSFDVRAGEAVGIVGESGCGKTVTALSILGLLPGNAEIERGAIRFADRDLVGLSEQELTRLRGKEIGFISQEPMVSLDPVFRVGSQLAECVQLHHGVSRREARSRAVDLLRRVHLPDPELVAARYPHQLSGGMAQRVSIARALTGEPRLLIADEPTTALDVTVQAEILELLRELQRERGMAILIVTHDWGVVADLCDRAVVMYAGQIVERGPLEPIFEDPLHPYTEALLDSNPHNAPEAELLPTIPGSVPRPGAWPVGCHFNPRCRYATDACREGPIALEAAGVGRQARCIHQDRERVRA